MEFVRDCEYLKVHTHIYTHTREREREKFEKDFFYLRIISRPLSIFHRSSSNVQNEIIIIIIIIILDNNYFLSKRNCLETSISIILRENQSWYTRLRWLLNGIPLIFKFTKSLVRSSENSSSKVNFPWLLCKSFYRCTPWYLRGIFHL